MESKQLNKILLLITFVISINVFSQGKMVDIEDKEFSINLKTEKRNLIKISDDNNYTIYYVLDIGNFDFDKKHINVDLVNIIFFSKKYNKGILALFKQAIIQKKKSVYNITLQTGSHGNNMFVSSIAILDKDFNYEYFMKYYYMPPPPPDRGDYKSWITIQDTKNYCNVTNIDIKGNAIYENIDDILSNISSVPKNNISRKCDPIIYDIDIRDFFPKKITR